MAANGFIELLRIAKRGNKTTFLMKMKSTDGQALLLR